MRWGGDYLKEKGISDGGRNIAIYVPQVNYHSFDLYFCVLYPSYLSVRHCCDKSVTDAHFQNILGSGQGRTMLHFRRVYDEKFVSRHCTKVCKTIQAQCSVRNVLRPSSLILLFIC